MRQRRGHSEREVIYPACPPGIRPLRLSDTATEYPEPWSAAITDDATITITIKKGATLKEALSKAHWEYFRRVQHIELEAAAKAVDLHSEAAKRQALWTACDAVVRKFVDNSNPTGLEAAACRATLAPKHLLDKKDRRALRRKRPAQQRKS